MDDRGHQPRLPPLSGVERFSGRLYERIGRHVTTNSSALQVYDRIWEAANVGTRIATSPEVKDYAKAVIQPSNSKALNSLLTKYLTDEYITIDEASRNPMLYDANLEKIIYNPKHADWKFYDKIEVITHEIAHLIDFEFGISVSLMNEIFEAVEEAAQIIFGNQKHYEELLDGDLGLNLKVSDLVSAFTGNKIHGAFGHKTDYWNQIGNVEREVVAELATIYYVEDKEAVNFIEEFPKLKKLFEEVRIHYEQCNKVAR